MVQHLRSPGFARQFDADLHTLVQRGHDHPVSFADRLIALDRISGTLLLTCLMVLSIWLVTEAAGAGLLKIPSAVASASDAAAIEAQNAGAAADRLTWTNIRDMQTKLTELGFPPGRIDGMAGPRTLDALNRYRAAQKLDPVSRVDRLTVADLLD